MEEQIAGYVVDSFVESRPRACQHKGGHCSADSGCVVGWWAVLGSVSARLLANAQFSLSPFSLPSCFFFNRSRDANAFVVDNNRIAPAPEQQPQQSLIQQQQQQRGGRG